jgi:hypothetical protein
LTGRTLEARLAEVAREAPQLSVDLLGLAGQGPFAEERVARADRLRGGIPLQIESDVRRGEPGEGRQSLVVERRDRPETRVLAGELSPAGAGLVELERGRDV